MKTISLPGGFAVLTAACGFANLANAQITPVSQDRYVFQSIGKEFFIESAPDFGPFIANDWATASQTSFITPLSVTGIGSVGPDDTFTLNSATSFFQLVFDVQTPTPFTLTGSLNLGFFGSGIAKLAGPQGNIIDFISSGEESFTWDVSGVLDPGQYTLEVFANMTISGGLSNWQFDFNMVPAPGGIGVLALMGLFARTSRRRKPAPPGGAG